MIDFKGSHFEKEIILWGVRWYVAYSISGSGANLKGGNNSATKPPAPQEKANMACQNDR